VDILIEPGAQEDMIADLARDLPPYRARRERLDARPSIC